VKCVFQLCVSWIVIIIFCLLESSCGFVFSAWTFFEAV